MRVNGTRTLEQNELSTPGYKKQTIKPLPLQALSLSLSREIKAGARSNLISPSVARRHFSVIILSRHAHTHTYTLCSRRKRACASPFFSSAGFPTALKSQRGSGAPGADMYRACVSNCRARARSLARVTNGPSFGPASAPVHQRANYADEALAQRPRHITQLRAVYLRVPASLSLSPLYIYICVCTCVIGICQPPRGQRIVARGC